MTFEEWKANNLQNDLLSKDEYQNHFIMHKIVHEIF